MDATSAEELQLDIIKAIERPEDVMLAMQKITLLQAARG